MKFDKSFELIFVRHAQSYGNVNEPWPEGFHEDDPPLTALGLKQAQALSERFEAGDVSKIFCSTLIRTAQTVQPTAEKLGLKAQMLPDLMEVETTIPGTPLEIAAALAPDSLFCEKEPSPAGGKRLLDNETTADLEARGKRCIDYFKSIAENGDRIIICSHACFFGYLIRPALGYKLPETFNFKIENCSVTSIQIRAGRLPLLLSLNDKSHLYKMN